MLCGGVGTAAPPPPGTMGEGRRNGPVGNFEEGKIRTAEISSCGSTRGLRLKQEYRRAISKEKEASIWANLQRNDIPKLNSAEYLT